MTNEQKLKSGLYILAVLSGMKIDVKQLEDLGPYVFASNGKQSVVIPSGDLREEYLLVNLKNICEANNIEFKGFYDKYMEARNPEVIDDLRSSILHNLADLPSVENFNIADNVEEMMKNESKSKKNLPESFSGTITTKEQFDTYLNYYYKYGEKKFEEVCKVIGLEGNNIAQSELNSNLGEGIDFVKRAHKTRMLAKIGEEPDKD